MQFMLLVIFTMSSGGLCAVRKPRLTVADGTPSYYYTNVDGKPGTYSFGYDFVDPQTGNAQFRSEERYPNGTVVGVYGFTDPRGKSRHFNYVADERGYRIKSQLPKKDVYTSSYISEQTTESSVTWTRPSKPKRDKENWYTGTVPRRQYNMLQRPSVYLLY